DPDVVRRVGEDQPGRAHLLAFQPAQAVTMHKTPGGVAVLLLLLASFVSGLGLGFEVLALLLTLNLADGLSNRLLTATYFVEEAVALRGDGSDLLGLGRNPVSVRPKSLTERWRLGKRPFSFGRAFFCRDLDLPRQTPCSLAPPSGTPQAAAWRRS